MLLSRLFRMGASDYLDDNPMKMILSCIFHEAFWLNYHSGESRHVLHDAPWLGKLLVFEPADLLRSVCASIAPSSFTLLSNGYQWWHPPLRRCFLTLPRIWRLPKRLRKCIQVPPDSKWGDCRHQGLCFPIPSYSFSPLSPSHDSKWGDFRRSRALLSHSKLICAYSAVARCQDSGVPLYHESNLTGVASPDRATRQCVTLIYTSNDFRCALSVFQEPLYGLPLSAHIWQLSTDATWPYSCGAITFEC